ncbi:MAG: hypothetical protein LBK60_03465, partial [Verrucomicrobiales bacterium]|nr:hypothetical protein [Verrucomicrobiales bacterium]
WQKHVTVSGSNGAFTVPDLTEYWGHDNTAHAFRVSADGYAPMNSSTIALDGQRHELSFALKPAADLEVQILTADGQPTSGAEAAVATIGSFFMVNDGKFDAQHGGDLLVRKSDAAGRLKIPPQDENAPWTLIVLHETGWAEITNYDLLNKSPLTVSLQRWSRVEGESRTGTRADADHELLFSKHSSGHDTAEKPWPNMRWQYNAKPDADGKFVFAQVPGGNVSVAKKIPPPNRRGWTSSYAQIFTLAAGETAPIVIGGTGRPIAGKFIIPKQFTDSGASFELARLWTIIKPENSDKMNGIFNFVPVNDDGTFNAPDIVPGDYMLQVSLMAADARVPIDPPLAMANVTVSVPPASEPASDEVFNLPPIPLQITGGKP